MPGITGTLFRWLRDWRERLKAASNDEEGSDT